MKPVTIPTNTSRHNDYASFDRGLFKYTTNSGIEKYARIAKATWHGKGDSSSPGILTYKVETFRRLPLRKEDISLYSEGIIPEDYQCVTRNLMNAPVVVEAFAITAFLKGYKTLDEKTIEETHRVSKMVLATSTNREISSMTTTFEFDSNHDKPLHYKSGQVEYITTYSGVQTSGVFAVTDPSVSTVFTVRKINV